ncbi:unnamed protein product [Linum trigynum]|uniref:Uncharacterized protein n=1 Tax=Linum trigynum TaxID=586398 RepID=A0AAV2D6V9_9ROSI
MTLVDGCLMLPLMGIFLPLIPLCMSMSRRPRTHCPALMTLTLTKKKVMPRSPLCMGASSIPQPMQRPPPLLETVPRMKTMVSTPHHLYPCLVLHIL